MVGASAITEMRRRSPSRAGIAMGTGTDVAMTSAQATLVKSDLRGIARARAISLATVKNMRQNLGFAFLYNALRLCTLVRGATPQERVFVRFSSTAKLFEPLRQVRAAVRAEDLRRRYA